MRNDYCTTIFGFTIDGHRPKKKKWINIQLTLNAMDILFQPNTEILSLLAVPFSSFLYLIFQPVTFYTGPVDFLK